MLRNATAEAPSRSGIKKAIQGKNRKFLLGSIIVLAALGYLMYTGFQGAAMYYFEVDELKAQGDSAYGQWMRVAGKVGSNSIERDNQSLLITFSIFDQTGSEGLMVAYRGVVPDLFQEGIDVVVEGEYTPAGIFEANRLLVKCPTKWEPVQ